MEPSRVLSCSLSPSLGSETLANASKPERAAKIIIIIVVIKYLIFIIYYLTKQKGN